MARNSPQTVLSPSPPRLIDRESRENYVTASIVRSLGKMVRILTSCKEYQGWCWKDEPMSVTMGPRDRTHVRKFIYGVFTVMISMKQPFTNICSVSNRR